jgi:hypothetical protein
MMIIRAVLAQMGLARPPLARAALDVQAGLIALENHLVQAKDARGLVLARRLHQALHLIAVDAPAGYVDLGALSATPKPPEEP